MVSRLRAVTRFGRPDFDQLFDEIKRAHPGQDAGVFFCGPVQLGASLRAACVRHSAPGVAQFVYKQEVF